MSKYAQLFAAALAVMPVSLGSAAHADAAMDKCIADYLRTHPGFAAAGYLKACNIVIHNRNVTVINSGSDIVGVYVRNRMNGDPAGGKRTLAVGQSYSVPMLVQDTVTVDVTVWDPGSQVNEDNLCEVSSEHNDKNMTVKITGSYFLATRNCAVTYN